MLYTSTTTDGRNYRQLLDSLKPQVLDALSNNYFLSELHKTLDEKSKHMGFLDLFSYFPDTSLPFWLKEEVANFTTEIYNDYLGKAGHVNEEKKRDYHLNVLLPVLLQKIEESLVVTIDLDSKNENNVESIHTAPQCSEIAITHNIPADKESLCPSWGGSFKDMELTNTCSVDSILALLSLHQQNLKTAIDIRGYTNDRLRNFASLVNSQEFDQLRYNIATELNIRKNNFLKYFNFFGSEATLINLLRKIDLANDIYNETVQCFSCNKEFITSIQIGSIGSIINNMQMTIEDRMQPIKCKACNSTDSNLERLKGYFHSIPLLLVFEIGHLPKLNCNLTASRIDESIFIRQHEKNLCYNLAGYTVSVKDHFYLLVKLDGIWYKYDGIRSPKIITWDSLNVYGTINSIFYILREELHL